MNNFEMIKHTEINEISFGVRVFDRQFLHFHPDLEIDLILEGNVLVRNASETREAQAGSVLLFNAYEMHELISRTAETVMLSLHIQKEFCRTYFPALEQMRFETCLIFGEDAGEVQQTEEEYYRNGIRKSLFHLGYNYYREEFGFELLCYSDLNSLLYAILKSVPFTVYRENLPEDLSGQDARLQRILDYIEDHYTERITLGDLADREHLSVSYLSHLIRNALGMSFQDYVGQLRFEHAIQLLVLTDRKLTDICLESGFSESKYFNRMFAENYHMKPAQLRKEAKNSWGSAVPGGAGQQDRTLSRQESLKVLRTHYQYSCDEREWEQRSGQP